MFASDLRETAWYYYSVLVKHFYFLEIFWCCLPSGVEVEEGRATWVWFFLLLLLAGQTKLTTKIKDTINSLKGHFSEKMKLKK